MTRLLLHYANQAQQLTLSPHCREQQHGIRVTDGPSKLFARLGEVQLTNGTSPMKIRLPDLPVHRVIRALSV